MDAAAHNRPSGPLQSNQRKAAVVFASLSHQLAEQVSMCLSEQHLSAMQTALASLGPVAAEERRQALTEFHAALNASQHDPADRRRQPGHDRFPSEAEDPAVGDVDIHALQQLLQDQHPQLIALVLSRLGPEKGTAVFASLPPDIAIEAGVRMALTENADESVVAYVDSLLYDAARSTDRGERKVAPDAHRVLRAGLRFADKEVKRGILNVLVDQGRADLAAEIGESLYVFEDLLSLEDRFLQRLLSQVTPTDLAMALKGVSQQYREVVFRNVSERAAEALREELELLGRVRRRDVEAAQQKFIEIANELVESGVIDLYPGEDEYVA